MYIIIIYGSVPYRYTPDGRSPRSLVSQSTGQALSRTTLRRADGSHREHGIRAVRRGAVVWSISVYYWHAAAAVYCACRAQGGDGHITIYNNAFEGKKKGFVYFRVCVRSTTFTFTLVRCTRLTARLYIYRIPDHGPCPIPLHPKSFRQDEMSHLAFVSSLRALAVRR